MVAESGEKSLMLFIGLSSERKKKGMIGNKIRVRVRMCAWMYVYGKKEERKQDVEEKRCCREVVTQQTRLFGGLACA
jgi:hypothetical protein